LYNCLYIFIEHVTVTSVKNSTDLQAKPPLKVITRVGGEFQLVHKKLFKSWTHADQWGTSVTFQALLNFRHNKTSWRLYLKRVSITLYSFLSQYCNKVSGNSSESFQRCFTLLRFSIG